MPSVRNIPHTSRVFSRCPATLSTMPSISVSGLTGAELISLLSQDYGFSSERAEHSWEFNSRWIILHSDFFWQHPGQETSWLIKILFHKQLLPQAPQRNAVAPNRSAFTTMPWRSGSLWDLLFCSESMMYTGAATSSTLRRRPTHSLSLTS